MVGGRKKGSPKAPGSGRKKGTLNSRSLKAMEVLASKGLDPLERLCEMYAKPGTPDVLKIRILENLMPYCYPKLTMIEWQPDAVNPAQMSVVALMGAMRKLGMAEMAAKLEP